MDSPLEQRIAQACRLTDELPLQSLDDRPPLASGSSGAIPACCFQTAESRRFGRSHHAALQSLRDLNPDLHFLLFDAARRDAYMAERWGDQPIGQLYRRARFGAMRADLFRYCVLFDQGGFYLDINKLVIAPLRSFVGDDHHGLISFESIWCQLPALPEAAAQLQHPSRYVLQWCLGFAPGHPLLAAMITNIERYAAAYDGRCFENPSEAVRSLSGPGLFTQTVRDYAATHSLASIAQAGIDFQGHLRYPTERELMYMQQPHYKEARHQPIFTEQPAG